MAQIFDVIPTPHYVILAKSGNLEKTFLSHPEFISGSTKKDAQNLFSMTIKSLDSRLRGNDILLLLSSHATMPIF